MAVDPCLKRRARPVGTAQRQREFPWCPERECELRRLALGEVGLHGQAHAGRGPLRGGRRVQVDPQPIIGLVVHPVAVEGVALHAGAHVAGEVAEHVLVLVGHALIPPAHGHHVAHAAVLGVDGREDMVEQRPLVVIGVVGIGPHGEQPPGQLEHVVGVARLARPAVDPIAQLVRRAEVLVLAVAAAREAVVLNHLVPEEARSE